MSAANKLIDKRLQEYKANPIFPLELGAIQTKFKNPRISVDDFKRSYQCDPIFCLTLIGLGWEATKKRANHPVAADHAMSIIGIQTAKIHFAKMKQPKNSDLSNEVRFMLTASVLAAHIIQSLSTNPHLHWASLFHQFPNIMMWHLDPKNMWRIQYRATQMPRKLSLFEASKLGFTLNDWRKRVAQKYHLSEYNQATYAKPPPNDPFELHYYIQCGVSNNTPILKHWHLTDSWLIVITNWLARSLLFPSLANSERHSRQIIQQATGISHKKLATIIGDSLTQTSQQLMTSKLFIPAVNALLLRSKSIYPDWLISPEIKRKRPIAFNQEQLRQLAKDRISDLNPKVKSTRKTPPITAPTRDQLIAEKGKPKAANQSGVKKNASQLAPSNAANLARRLIKQPQQFENAIQMISLTLKSIIEDLGYDRVSLLNIEWKGQFAATKLALARPGLKKIRPDFSFKPGPMQPISPLQKFTEQQGCLAFNQQKHGKIWPKLPQAILKEKISQFYLFSIKPGARVKILIYVDAKDATHFEPEVITGLKSLLTALNRGLISRELIKQKSANK